MKPPPLSRSRSTGGSAPARLLAWFDRHRRDLPWRHTRDPYRIWISEVMLQQTRVETVIPYYERFVDRYPTLGALAAADEEEVMAAWSGLGYYRRARNLLAAARLLSEEGRDLPRTAAELRGLPGFGPYTAAAVASIAFDEPVPVLDGNVVRLTARLTAERDGARTAAVRRRLESAAARLLDADRPGDGNQAMMELGATICTPRRPACEACPLRVDCVAAAQGDPELYPAPRPARPPLRVRRTVLVVERQGRVLLFRREDHRRVLAGTWELPFVDEADDDEALLGALAARYGGSWGLGPVRGRVRHSITHRAFSVEVRDACRSSAEDEVAEESEARWAGRDELARMPLSSLVGKALAARDRGVN